MKIRISDLCDNLNSDLYSELEAIEQESIQFSTEHIKEITFAKLEEQKRTQHIRETGISPNKTNEKKSASGKRLRQLLIAAIVICISCATVFAFNNEEFFKQLFGEDISSIENSIELSNETVSDKNFRLTLESTLLYGNVNYFIVSLERLDGGKFSGDETPKFNVKSNNRIGLMRLGVDKMESSDSTATKEYYSINVASDRILTGDILSIEFKGMLDTKKGKVSLSSNLIIAAKNIDDRKIKIIDIEPEKESGYYFTKVYISPVGMMIVGEENNTPNDKIPTAKIKLNYKNGTSESLSGNTKEKIQIIISRNVAHNTFTNQYKFNKLRDVNEIKSIEINEQKYMIN